MVLLSEGNRSRPLQVGLYELTKTLGRGNFAVVKLAVHKVTKTQVAIKIIDKTKLSEADLGKVYREVQIMKQLNHPYIIKLYQVMETKDMLYMVLEYATNGELFDYLSCSGRLSEMEARKKFWQILQAVEYCHKNDIVHRDLKAENLLLDANMDLKLADFGFGNFYSERGAMSTWCGSPPYAAPEVFEGRNYQGPAVDIWSLGVVLYVMVCGSLPFDGPSLPTLRQRVLDGRFRIPFFMSHDCENLIRRMLSVDPSRRITMAQIKDHGWLHFDQPAVHHHQTPRRFPSPADRPRPPLCPEGEACQGKYSEPVLAVMQTLGVDRQKTIESLDNKSYNHFSGIYWLLLERANDLRGHGRRSEVIPEDLRQAAGRVRNATDEEEEEEGRPSDSGEEEEDQEEEGGGAPCSGVSGTDSRRRAFGAAAQRRMRRQTPLSSFDDVSVSSDSCQSSSCCNSSCSSSCCSSPRHTPPPSPPVSTAAASGGAAGGPPAQPPARAEPTRCGLPVPGFEECRRASDTCGSLDLRVFQQQLRREARSKGLLGLDKVGTDGPMDPQQDWSPEHGPQGSVSPRRLTCVPIPVHDLLQRNIQSQRVAVSPPRHHFLLLSPRKAALPLLMVPPPPHVAAPAPPLLHLHRELENSSSSRPAPAGQYLSLSSRPNGHSPPPSTQTFLLPAARADQPLDLSRSASSTSPSSSPSSSNALVDSAVLLLDSHLHIKAEDLSQAGYVANVHVYPQSPSSQPRPCRPGQALLKAQPSPVHPSSTAAWREDLYGPNTYMGTQS